MINLALRSEYSFQKTYGRIKDIFETQKDKESIGVSDINNTFSHYYLYEYCKDHDKKPIFGVRLMVVPFPEEKVKPRGQFGAEYIFIAKNRRGLSEIYQLVNRSIVCFYYRAHIGIADVIGLSKNVIVIAPHFITEKRIDFVAVCNVTSNIAMESKIPKVAINNNWMINADDKDVYQLFAGSRKMDRFTFPMHILSDREWNAEYNDINAIDNTYQIAKMCNVKFPIAKPVRYKGAKKIRTVCKNGAKKLNIDLKDPVYKERFKRELKLIKNKDFSDYFMIVYEMVKKAKETMLVGSGRGSSGGSLICYLLGITTVDPVKWDLLFERFIDVNRFDMPDIDIDFPDTKRQQVIDELIKTNGADNVKNIATISEIRHRSAIGYFAKELNIDPDDSESIKNSMAMADDDDDSNDFVGKAFDTELGELFIEKYPGIENAARIEGHSRHSGTHAAGIIVATKPLYNFGSVNPKDNTIQIDKKVSEKMNLLKIDCLGLKTLSVIEEISDLVDIPYSFFYDIDLYDEKVFRLFRDMKLKGVFQFEGQALTGLCRTIKVRDIEDIIAITALARPGALQSGGAARFSKIHSGQEEIEYIIDSPEFRKITKSTMGIIVYQEQVIQIMREIAGFPWDKVGGIRKAISNKEGSDSLDEYKKGFVKGVRKSGETKKVALIAWEKIMKFAKYGFNRSHSVEYGLISYWTAWTKVYHPLEFLIANLNHPKNLISSMRLIREMKETHDFEFIPFDPAHSCEKWIVKGNKIIGALTNIHGIGAANARVIVRKRETGEALTPSVAKKLEEGKTVFDVIYPCKHYWGKMFTTPKKYGLFKRPSLIKNVVKKDEYLIIAQLMKKNVKNLNSSQKIMDRDGEVFEDNTKALNITVEDDTGTIMCQINRFDYSKLGEVIAEDGEIESDWYLIRGKIISDDMIFLFVSEIHKLGDGITEGQTIKDVY